MFFNKQTLSVRNLLQYNFMVSSSVCPSSVQSLSVSFSSPSAAKWTLRVQTIHFHYIISFTHKFSYKPNCLPVPNKSLQRIVGWTQIFEVCLTSQINLKYLYSTFKLSHFTLHSAFTVDLYIVNFLWNVLKSWFTLSWWYEVVFVSLLFTLSESEALLSKTKLNITLCHETLIDTFLHFNKKESKNK